jgi:hypothetical protein
MVFDWAAGVRCSLADDCQCAGCDRASPPSRVVFADSGDSRRVSRGWRNDRCRDGNRSGLLAAVAPRYRWTLLAIATA